MAKSVKLTSEKYYWTCPQCEQPHVLFSSLPKDEVKCGRCRTEFKTVYYDMKQELKLTQERLKMVEFTLGQYKKILKGGMSELIDPVKVVVHYRCCECKVTITIPLKELPAGPFVCDECDFMENFMEIVAVGVKAE